MVGSAGTRQPAESRSQACRRACPAHDARGAKGVRARDFSLMKARLPLGWFSG